MIDTEGEAMRKKVMLSQPMAGKTNEEIAATRERATDELEKMGYEVIDTYFTDEVQRQTEMKQHGVVHIPLCYLAMSLEKMSLCHAVYFGKGWENTR